MKRSSSAFAGSGVPCRVLRRVGEAGVGLSASVSVCTLAAWYRGRDRLPQHLSGAEPLAVIYDECHWAQNAEMGRALLKTYLGRTAVVGLTATPIQDRDRLSEVIFSRTFMELVDIRLARPQRRHIETGVTRDPICNSGGDFSPGSLGILGDEEKRNGLIVEEVAGSRAAGRYKKVIVFASGIGHAEEFDRRLGARGVPSRVVHTGLPSGAREQALADFRAGRVDVLVNVQQLAEGVDLPMVDAVVLARSTTSETRFKQMVGRGARLAPGKNHFHIVEFSDTFCRFRDAIFRSDRLDLCSGAPTSASVGRRKLPERHDAPRGEPEFTNLVAPGLESVSFVRGQTFGVEIELTGPQGIPRFDADWHRLARILIEKIASVAAAGVHPHPLGYHENHSLDMTPTCWYVTHDSSAGWELVSPVLADEEGFAELERVGGVLRRLTGPDSDFTVNHCTGLHLTLGTRLNSREKLLGFVHRLQRLEPGLYTLVAPSRLYPLMNGHYDLRNRNEYCAPFREEARRELADALLDRYHSVNLTHASDDIQKLEVRLHHGTVDFHKIALWVSLWMNIFNHSRYQWTGSAAHGRVFPRGNCGVNLEQVAREDILALLDNEGIHLRQRREMVWTSLLVGGRCLWGRFPTGQRATAGRPHTQGVVVLWPVGNRPHDHWTSHFPASA